MKAKALIILYLFIISALSCKKNEKVAHQAKGNHHEAWSYQGETSPEHWAEIIKDSDCAGIHQSPVNIVAIDSDSILSIQNSLKRIYSPETNLSKVENNGHSIQFDFEVGDSIYYKNSTFHLKQIHFHEPAEHTINGIKYPIEMHLVHANKNGDYTVLGILGEEGKESQLFEFFESFLPLKEGETKTINHAINLESLFPTNNDYYSYQGSLTTPPCTENVNWVVYKEPIILSVDEVNKLKNNMPLNNYRNEQPLNDRVVNLNYTKD